jgi:ubiquinone/menaquinone biosynthesis C-methylase UbiE
MIFDGPLGLLTARFMAKGNIDAEREAVAELAPEPDHDVLAVGYGPGIGIEELVPKVGSVGGVDPSWAMTTLATRRNKAAARAGKVRLERCTVDRLPWPDDSFDGVISVNTIQLWSPLDRSVAELARTMRPGAKLVTLTHEWVIKRAKRTTVAAWFAELCPVFEAAGFTDVRHWQAKAEDGHSIGLAARLS